jgi:hypothetical protein
MKKPASITILILFGILLIGGGVYFAVFNTPQSIIPSQCTISTGGTTTGSFPCPSDSSCIATVKLDCTKSSIEPKVIFRTNALVYNGRIYSSTTDLRNTYSNKWLAVDTSNSGVLTGFVYSGYGSSTPSRCTYAGTIAITKLDGTKLVTKDGLDVALYSKSGTTYLYLCQGSKYVSFVPDLTSISIEKSATETEPYSLNNQEIVDGTANIYQCSQSVTGSKTKLINYSGPVPGFTKESFALTSGQSINWVGDIEYTIGKTKTSECTKNVKVSSNTYYLCITDSNGCGIVDKTQIQSCGTLLFNENTGLCETPTRCIASNGQIIQKGNTLCTSDLVLEKCVTPPTITKETASSGKVCRDGKIVNAYTVSTSLSSLVLSTSDKLKVEFVSDLTSKDVTATIYKSSTVIQTKTQQTSSGKTSFTFDTLSVGYYTVKISFSDTHGDYEKTYDFQVTESLTVVLDAKSLTQFNNLPIEVMLKSYKSGNFKDLSDKQIEATFNGIAVSPETIEHPSLGLLVYYYNLKNKGDGNLRVRARGQDETGLWTDWTEYFQIEVKKASILISTEFINDKCTGTLENKFFTKDSQGNYINTNNIVKIDKPLGGSDTVSTTGTNGKYSFSYNFIEGGLYIVRITSSNELGSSQLNAGQGQTINILTGTACNGGDDDFDWKTLLIISVLVLGIGLFVYFVVIRRK